MALRMAITVFWGVEREKISQYVLEKLLLFVFSVSDPVSLGTKTRPGRAGEGVAAAAWSQPSSPPPETPIPLPVGQRQHQAPPRAPSTQRGCWSIWAPKALGVPGVGGGCPPGQVSALGPLSPHWGKSIAPQLGCQSHL